MRWWVAILLLILSGRLIWQSTQMRKLAIDMRSAQEFNQPPQSLDYFRQQYGDPSSTCWRVESGNSARYMTTGMTILSLEGPCFESRASCEQHYADGRSCLKE